VGAEATGGAVLGRPTAAEGFRLDVEAAGNELRKRNFMPDDWVTACKENGLPKAEADKALEQLFEASAVGIHGAGGAQGGSQTTYRYQDRHLRSRPDATHQVHLALVRELGLKDA
jgi:hypothetical protein